MKKLFKVGLAVVISAAVVTGGMYGTDLCRMKNNENVIFSTWGRKYTPAKKMEQI